MQDSLAAHARQFRKHNQGIIKQTLQDAYEWKIAELKARLKQISDTSYFMGSKKTKKQKLAESMSEKLTNWIK